ncbi:multimerin-2a isoform X2 [Larimichthys crocea]|uniref:multimerin-2a isoform X2 n=1 Tax=Larimichthys crocea TaxID=215358 RepID=UPI000F5EA574|nr:multimerin-2 isoform X2 [Larimichthys crocea]
MWTRADMTAVGELVLVLGLLVSAHCELRTRDHGVEEEEGELGARGAGGAAAGGGGGAFPARTGNWCAFVQTRAVTVSVMCGTESYIVRSQSPCPSGSPNCQAVMYKQAVRPVYRQKQQINTALLWRCCPGHGGRNCEDIVSDKQPDSGSSAPVGGTGPVKTEHRAQDYRQEQLVDVNREQNDYQGPVSELNVDTDDTDDTDFDDNHEHNTTPAPGPAQHTNLQHDVPAVLSAPHMMALVMSQLYPVLEGFNRSLEHLSRQVRDLARDVAQLKSAQPVVELQAGPPELDEAAEERLDAKLDEAFQHVREVQRQMEIQRMDMESKLHSQHAMLHYNLTSFKTDIDMKLKRQQKMLQISLQAMNATLYELKLDQDQATVDQPEDQPEDQLPPPNLQQPLDTSNIWEAIERLDNMVVNNTVKVGGLMEDMEVTSGNVQQLRQDLKKLGKQINQTGRNSQIQFMETGLEVEAAKEVVLRQVSELAGNLSQQSDWLQEMNGDLQRIKRGQLETDLDVDHLYTAFYKQNTSGDCECKELKAAVAHLERGVANVTELANENRLVLEDNSDIGAVQWGGARDWEPVVESLQQGLQEVKESLALEQTRTRSLKHSLTQLSSSVNDVLAEFPVLKEANKQLVENMQRLSGSFQSLLKDTIRHSDVLELLLGEEVLDFLEWPVEDQEANSIPALKEQLGNLREQLRWHNLSITSLQGNRPGREEVPSADQPSPSDVWLPGSMKRSSGEVPTRERQLLLLHPEGRRPEHRGDGSDLWNLEKTVEELELKVLRLEEKPCNTTAERNTPPDGVEAKLQAEVMWLKRGLEEHLRMFKNVFSNADVLAGSDATLELDKLWQLVKNKDGKKEKKRGGGGHHRNRRDASGVVPLPSSLSEDSLLLVAESPLSVSDGIIALEASLNRGEFYSDTGTFTAPGNGIYLFVLTLDLRPGPAQVVLRKRSGGSGGDLVSLHRQEVREAGPVTGLSLLPLSEGEEVRLELMEGAWTESENNVFTVLLLRRTT